MSEGDDERSASDPIERDAIALPLLQCAEAPGAPVTMMVYDNFCATAHRDICASSNAAMFNSSCGTGLRIYDGSKILTGFFASHAETRRRLAQLFLGTPSSPSASSSPSQPLRAIELGCGCGLSGLSAAAVLAPVLAATNTAATFTFTDLEPRCLDMARRNAALNEALFAVARSSASPPLLSFEFSRLKWDPEDVAAHLRGITPPARYELVFAAELLYFRVDARALVNTVAALLCPRRGLAFFCHVNRIHAGEGTRAGFPSLLAAAGLQYRVLSVKAALAASPVAAEMMTLASRADFIVASHSADALDAALSAELLLQQPSEQQPDDDGMPGAGLLD